MSSSLHALTSESCGHVASLTRRMFGYDCSAILRQMLANPLLRDGASAGDVAYQDGRCVGFQAAIARDLYWRGERFRGIVGSTLAMAPEASPVLLLNLMKATVAPRDGSQMFLANTANAKSMKLNRMLGVKGRGPASCEQIRFAALSPGSFLRFASRRRLPRFLAALVDGCLRVFFRRGMDAAVEEVQEIEVAEFDAFWRRYLASSVGLVSSRTGAEVAWAFVDGICSGQNVMLAWRDAEGVKGYVVARAADPEGLRWRIADWIAVRDDPDVLAALVRALVRRLRARHGAGVLESIGFNDAAQGILKRYLPWMRKAPNNSFLWKITDPEFEKVCRPDFSTDWFWGPYDGDRFMD